MRFRSRALVGLVALSLVAAACGDDGDGAADTTAAAAETTAAAAETTAAAAETTAAAETSAAPTETTEAPLPERGDADLVIWVDETRDTVIGPLAEQFGTENGVKVAVSVVGFDDMREAVNQTVPRGTGPDLFLGAHDWVGELVQNGVVAPVDLGASSSNYNPIALEAFSYGGKLYGLPYAVENLALFRNTDLVPTAPATFEDLQTVALDLKAQGTVDVPLAVQQDPADPYHNEPMFTAAGGYIFGTTPDGTYNPEDIGIDSPGGLEAATLFNEWAKAGLISSDVTYDIMISSFATGKAPFAITGPWAISGFKETNPDVKYVVEAIPPVNGGPTKPFIGSQGFLLSAKSEATDLATTFLLDFVNTPETAMALFEAQPRPPAYTSVLEELSSDPDIQGFAAAGAEGQPLPNIPEMSAVWESFEAGYVNAFKAADSAGAQEAFKLAAEEIRAKIAAS